MRLYRHLRIITLLFFIALVPAVGDAQEPDLQQVLEDLDAMSNFYGKDFSCVYTIVSQKPGEEQSVTKIRLFRRDERDQFVLLILKPEVNKGQGYLQVDENVWFYDPESRKFSHSSLRENVQDSEAKNSDFNRSSFAEDYSVKAWKRDTLGKYPVYVMELEALNDEVSYPRMKIWVRRDIHLILKEEDYSVSDRLMRTALYPRYSKVGENYLPSQILIIDQLEEGQRSQITMRDASVAKLPDSVFTKAYLERVNN